MRRLCLCLVLALVACEDGPGEADEGRRPGDIVFEPDLPNRPDTGEPSFEGDRPNAAGVAPTCRILTPAEGAVFPSEGPIRFSAEIDDLDGDIAFVLWSSNVWGAMVLGPVFDFALPADRHQVTLRVTDEAGHLCLDRVTITVTP